MGVHFLFQVALHLPSYADVEAERAPSAIEHRVSPDSLVFFFFTLVTGPRRFLSLKLSDTSVYEPQIRSRIGTGVEAERPSSALHHRASSVLE